MTTLRYNQRLSRGVCPRCGRPRDSDAVRCSICNNADKEWHRQHYTTECNRVARRNQRARYRAAGLCRNCGNWVETPGATTCNRCRAKRRRHYAEHRLDIKVQRILSQSRKESCHATAA